MSAFKSIPLLLLLLAFAAKAADAPNPVIAHYGKIQPTSDALEQPSKSQRYQVIFNITKGARQPSEVNPSLDKVARFLNLLGRYDVRPAKSDVIAIIHGEATDSVMDDAAYRERYGVSNPNLELFKALSAAGVSVRVCSQALAAHRIGQRDVADHVQRDVAALTTLANFQLQGYALLPD